MDIFVSVGRTATPQQEAFVRAIEDFLRANGLEPKTMGRTSFSSGQPLHHIRRLMESCSGVVIIGFERLFVDDGLEFRGSSIATQIGGTTITTVWNQVEAALAYALDRPPLVLMQKGLREEGLLAEGLDWFIERIDFNPASLSTVEFQGVFNHWKAKVMESSRDNHPGSRPLIDPDKLSVSELLSSLKTSHVYAVAASALAALAAAATAGYWFGQTFLGHVK